ncbi:MAG: DUF3793 family protein [Mogibacterium sp.]|nr:DUF3793 family protein [Mogibacterium sp.]
MLENYLIEYCSPTLASLKSGSLFNCKCSQDAVLDESISEWNSILSSRGIRIHLLRRTDTTALIYVYRQSSLEYTLSDPEIQTFLHGYGYQACSCCSGCIAGQCSIENCLMHLEARITCADGSSEMRFPHEIGIFLGYPLADVTGFIRNKGRNCKCIGTWKVYGDASSARKTFARFNKCSDVYNRLWKSGRRSVLQLTVAG